MRVSAGRFGSRCAGGRDLCSFARSAGQSLPRCLFDVSDTVFGVSGVPLCKGISSVLGLYRPPCFCSPSVLSVACAGAGLGDLWSLRRCPHRLLHCLTHSSPSPSFSHPKIERELKEIIGFNEPEQPFGVKETSTWEYFNNASFRGAFTELLAPLCQCSQGLLAHVTV